jgi:DNA-binding SARP family transcriptional activator
VLTLRLLGPFEAGGVKLPTRKSEALLGYLGLEAGTAHRRDSLMALLWGDRGDRQARHSLSQTLSSLRKALGDHADSLIVDGDCIMLSEAGIAVDARRFQALAATESCDDWNEAGKLYRGELLQGLHLREPGYQDWVAGERSRFREAALAVQNRLVQHHEAGRALDAAMRAALRLLALDPLRESAHRALMRLYAAQGETAAALRQYDHCVALLDRELGVEPEAETRQLYAEITRRRRTARRDCSAPAALATPPREPATQAAPEPAGRAGAPSTAVMPAADLLRVPPAQSPVPAPPAIFGRDGDLQRLEDRLADALTGKRQLVFIAGEAGLGKTTLVDAFLARVAESRPDIRIGHGQCMDLRGPGEPFMPVLEMLTMLGRASADVGYALVNHAPSWVLQLPGLGLAAAAGIDGVPTRERMLRELLDALEAMAIAHPLLLVLEDLHWSDCSTLDLIDAFARRRGATPILVLGTCRLSDPPTALATVLDLRSRGLAGSSRYSLSTRQPPMSALSRATTRRSRTAWRPSWCGAAEATRCSCRVCSTGGWTGRFWAGATRGWFCGPPRRSWKAGCPRPSPFSSIGNSTGWTRPSAPFSRRAAWPAPSFRRRLLLPPCRSSPKRWSARRTTWPETVRCCAGPARPHGPTVR